MTGEFHIRPAGFADVTAMHRIETLSFLTRWSRWSFYSELLNPLSTILVATPAGDPSLVVGYLIYWVAAAEMHILNLAVHPRWRRRGVARLLLTTGLARAREQGAHTAWLEVRPSNLPALALYESLGFVPVGRRPGYYEDTGEDALILELELGEPEEA
ncbi:MAG: ribosomal protein S18-alanine N-acetyltransferase [Syntrophobacterales bacterium]|nr:ribosomal protein S18-alanine N-acetyltransferase [Syntrophobacterales bacterium]